MHQLAWMWTMPSILPNYADLFRINLDNLIGSLAYVAIIHSICMEIRYAGVRTL